MRLGECWWGAGVGCEGLLEQHQLSLAGDQEDSKQSRADSACRHKQPAPS